MSVDSSSFRAVMGNFATGCTVVTLPGEPHGITVNAFSSVSLDPPLCLICADHETTCHERLSTDTDGYAVNVLTDAQRDLGEHFAEIDELDEDPFEARPTRTEVTGAPIFEESIAYVDCTVEAAHEAGDHTIYVGRAKASDLLNESAEPLLYFRGQWDERAGE